MELKAIFDVVCAAAVVVIAALMPPKKAHAIIGGMNLSLLVTADALCVRACAFALLHAPLWIKAKDKGSETALGA